jgi:hypothetical protein
MNKFKAAVKFLFSQNKIVIAIAVIFTQFPALADIEYFAMSPRVSYSGLLKGIIFIEIITILIALPALLFAFKVTDRLNKILGTAPAAIIFFVALLMAFNGADSSPTKPGGEFAFGLLISVYLALILSVVLFIAKGKSSFFENSTTPSPTTTLADTSLSVDATLEGHKFCDNCGADISVSSKFCRKCGNKVVVV